MPKQIKDSIPTSSFLNLPVPPSWKATDQLNAYESWVYTAVNAIAHEVASVEIRLFKKKFIKDQVDYQEIYEHEALSLLDGVNPYSNKYIHIFETIVYLELLGESYWAVMRDASNRPVSMWQLRPDKITIVPSEKKVIDHYLYRIGNEEYRLESENVIPFRFMNPNQPYRGKSPVQSVAMAIDTDKFSADWNRTFFFNSAIPNMILTTDQNLTKEQVERLATSWANNFQGRDNAHKVAFLTSGFKPVELGQNIRDMDFIEQRKALRDEILGVFKVPKTVIGLTDDVNRANAEATTMAFMERTVTPIIKMFVAYLNEFYLPMWGDDTLFFDFDDPSPEDVETKLKTYENGLKNGWLTINEVRERENLDPVEGGDVIYLPFGVHAIGEEPENPFEPNPDNTDEDTDEENTDDNVDTDNEEEQRNVAGVIKLNVLKGTVKKQRKFNAGVPHKKLSAIRQEAIEGEINQDLVKLIQFAMKVEKEKEEVEKPEIDVKELYWKKMIEKTDLDEMTMVEKLNKLFEDQQREVMDKVATLKSVKRFTKSVADKYLFDQDAWEVEFRKEFGKFIEDMVIARASEVMSFMGGTGTISLTTQRVLDFLNDEGLRFAKQVNETTRDNLIDQLSQGIKQGESIPELSNRVLSVYKEATDSRAEMIARTEVLRANNFATVEAYNQSEVVVEKEWYTALDEMVCPYCAPLHGQRTGKNGVFKSAEFGNVEYPPLHPRCRCTTLPVIEQVRSVSSSIKGLSKKKLNNMIERKLLLVADLDGKINEFNEDIEKAKTEAQNIKDKALKEAEESKQEILDIARKQAEEEKEQLLRDLKALRYKVSESLRHGRK